MNFPLSGGAGPAIIVFPAPPTLEQNEALGVVRGDTCNRLEAAAPTTAGADGSRNDRDMPESTVDRAVPTV